LDTWRTTTCPSPNGANLLYESREGSGHDKLSHRQHWWLDILNEFDYNIEYILGNTNEFADALSRIYSDELKGVVRAESDYGKRLNIRKATLRKWRKAFVRHLRNHGVASKATQRSTRERARMSKLNGIYRPARTPRAFPQKVAHAVVKVRPPNFRASLNDRHPN